MLVAASLHVASKQHAHFMRPYSPRSTLVDQTPLQRSEVKTNLVCSWLSLFGHSIENVLLDLLQVQARGVCRRLERAGLLRAVPVQGSKAQAWALTAAGLRRAEGALGRRVRYLSHPGRLTLSRFGHELAVQREAILRLPTDLPALRRLRADRELQALPAAVRPDLVVRHVGEQSIETLLCIEVEVSAKSTREVREKLRAIRDTLTPRTLWLWYIREPATCARYARIWRQVVNEGAAGPVPSPAWLIQACHFEVAQGTAPS